MMHIDKIRVIWFQTINISQSWRNTTTIREFSNLPLQFLTSLKYATKYVRRQLEPSCRCIRRRTSHCIWAILSMTCGTHSPGSSSSSHPLSLSHLCSLLFHPQPATRSPAARRWAQLSSSSAETQSRSESSDACRWRGHGGVR
jgi:hypothetical protein